MRLRPAEPMTSSYRRYVAASVVVPFLLFIDVSANFGVYVARSGLCTGTNLASISRIQTLGAGALPLALPYRFTPQANILVAGLDLSVVGITTSVIWIFTLLMFIRLVLHGKHMLASFCIAVLVVTFIESKIEKTYSCDLLFAHKNAEAIFSSVVSRHNNGPSKNLYNTISQTALSENVIQISGLRGEPTCPVYILKTSFAPGHDLEVHPSWHKATEILDRQDAKYADPLTSIAFIQDYKASMLLSLNAFRFSERNEDLQFYSLLACDPTRMPAF